MASIEPRKMDRVACAVRPEPRAGKATPRLSAVRTERAIELCECMIDIAAAVSGVAGRELRRPGKTSLAAARIRQMAMYVCHVVLGLSMSEVGSGFQRDRTTVVHACHLVEDLRDDPDFERMVVVLERIAQAAFGDRVVR
jgi:hypothetical protein